MRGKLRDKYSTNKRDSYRSEEGEFRRSNKRGGRPTQWVDQMEDDDLDLDFDNYEEDEAEAEELLEEQDFAPVLPEEVSFKRSGRD